MTEYGKECVRDYINALVRAERLMRDSEHDLWMVDEVNDLTALVWICVKR